MNYISIDLTWHTRYLPSIITKRSLQFISQKNLQVRSWSKYKSLRNHRVKSISMVLRNTRWGLLYPYISNSHIIIDNYSLLEYNNTSIHLIFSKSMSWVPVMQCVTTRDVYFREASRVNWESDYRFREWRFFSTSWCKKIR